LGKTAPTLRLADLGLHRLARLTLVFQGCSAGLVVASLRAMGLSVDWPTLLPFLAINAALLTVWIHHWRAPGKPQEWILAECALAMFLTIQLTHILSPAQYVAAALNRPLIDPFLARADAFMGVDVSALAAWSRAHPRINFLLVMAYSSFIVQLAIVPIILGIVLRDRVALWEYVFNFHFCAAITVTMLALFPAACAFQYYGFESTIDQTRFIEHFNGVRDGSFTRLQFGKLEGLISMPSFHVAGAFMVLWAMRRHPRALLLASLVNILLIAATVTTGAHYAVDLVGTVVMFAISVWVWRVWGYKLMDISPVHLQSPSFERAS
jgi:hypothetical protein